MLITLHTSGMSTNTSIESMHKGPDLHESYNVSRTDIVAVE